MREYKFRAWDNEANLMIYSDHRNRKLYDAYYYFETDSKGELKCNWESEWTESCQPDGGAFNNLMQYTGFKDDNGAEIYEGDILERTDSENETIGVIFDTDKCGLLISYIQYDEVYDFEELPPCKVIGNIYANAEMVKEK